MQISTFITSLEAKITKLFDHKISQKFLTMPKTIRDNADIDKTFAPLFDSMLLTLLADTSLKILTFFTIFFLSDELVASSLSKEG